MQRIAFIGLGNMGAPMAANLLKAGFELTVFNRSPEKMRPLTDHGAHGTASIAEAVRDAEATVIMVTDDAAVRAIVFGEDGVLANAPEGQLLIDMSTVSPETNRGIAEMARERDLHFLEAPVLGSVKPATEGTLIILAGGEPEVFETARPILQAMGKEIAHLGGVGTATHMKICVNMVMGVSVQVVAEAIVLAEKGGLDRAQLLNILSSGNLQSQALKAKTPLFLEDNYPASFALKHMAKDLSLAIGQALQYRTTIPTAAAGRETFAAAQNLGHGDLDVAGILKALEQMNGVTRE